MSEKLLTPREVCALLNISYRTLRRLCAGGEISYVYVRGQLRFRPAAVELYIAKNTVLAR